MYFSSFQLGPNLCSRISFPVEEAFLSSFHRYFLVHTVYQICKLQAEVLSLREEDQTHS